MNSMRRGKSSKTLVKQKRSVRFSNVGLKVDDMQSQKRRSHLTYAERTSKLSLQTSAKLKGLSELRPSITGPLNMTPRYNTFLDPNFNIAQKYSDVSLALQESKVSSSTSSMVDNDSTIDGDLDNHTPTKQSKINADLTFKFKNAPKRPNKEYNVGYVLKSLLYSQKYHKMVYLKNDSGKKEVQGKLFHPTINMKSKRLTRNSTISSHTKASLARTRATMNRTSMSMGHNPKTNNILRNSMGFQSRKKMLSTASSLYRKRLAHTRMSMNGRCKIGSRNTNYRRKLLHSSMEYDRKSIFHKYVEPNLYPENISIST
jgi:hypothetical protein